MKNGLLIGFSGGADSVMLLHLMLYHRLKKNDFKIVCVHINHGIRGDEAERDEYFSRNLCESVGVEFISQRFDIPALSKEYGEGLEECARNIRYSCFDSIISSRNDLSVVATAHNSNDNLETILLNILRGAGSRGGSGIPPIRDNIIRPMLYVSKKDIISCLEEFKISFVNDSTNLLSDYKRNYIRNNIAPLMFNISEDPLEMFNRFSNNLRSDDDFILYQANIFLNSHTILKNSDLLSLHKAVLIRVLSKLFGVSVSESLFSDIIRVLKKDDFSYTVKKDIIFESERGVCRVKRSATSNESFHIAILHGVNHIPEFFADFIISSEEKSKTSLKVYSFSIQQNISSAIISGSLYLRPKLDGDTIFYGGMTHKIKKLFCDSKIPRDIRKKIPLLCDDNGIVWVPGFGVRDDGGNKTNKGDLFAVLCIKEDSHVDRLYSASEFRT